MNKAQSTKHSTRNH